MNVKRRRLGIFQPKMRTMKFYRISNAFHSIKMRHYHRNIRGDAEYTEYRRIVQAMPEEFVFAEENPCRYQYYG